MPAITRIALLLLGALASASVSRAQERTAPAIERDGALCAGGEFWVHDPLPLALRSEPRDSRIADGRPRRDARQRFLARVFRPAA